MVEEGRILRDHWDGGTVWHTASEAVRCLNFPEEAKATLRVILPPADLSRVKLTVQVLASLREGAFTPTPKEGEDYGSDLDLFNTVVLFLKKYVQLVAEIYYLIGALFALASWRVEKAENASYLYLIAPHGSGKSTLLKILAWLCKNSIHSEGATRGAIIRACDSKNATLLLDETDTWLSPSDHDNPLSGVLNAGYQRRVVGGVLLCEYNQESKKYETRILDSFGFKALSGRNPLNDVLASRCIRFPMRKTSQVFPKLDLNEAWLLRARLVRYGQLHQDPLRDEFINQIQEPRLREVFEPLLACAPSDAVRSDVIKFAFEEQARLRETERTGDEAEIARKVIAFCQVPNPPTEITVRAITDSLNAEITNPNEQYDNRYVGRILKRLTFESKHTKKGSSILLKPDLIDYLKERYGSDEAATQ